ncbi:MAG: isocitrate/isopropylmalate dehydrogenase family protein [Chloroflexaceae bacterium]
MQVCIIPGDGIGTEVIEAALQVLQAVADELPLETVTAQAGWGTFQQTGTALPEATLDLARASDAVLFGAVASPSHAVPGYRSPIVALRRELNLYANIRPTRSIDGIGSPHFAAAPVDLVVVRENTEGLYAGRERLEDDGDTAIAERVITRRGSERIVRHAFTLAEQRRAAGLSDSKVTVVHKANVLRVTDGLFREVALAVARDYPQITLEELLVDTAAMRLAQSPERFDVIVTTNMFGDILSDVACIHGGGLGLASSANIGDRQALFEPVHGAAPDIAGQGVANPLAAIGCIAMLLEWAMRQQPGGASGEAYAGAVRRVRAAAAETLKHGPYPPDLGGTATTGEVTAAVIARVRSNI